MSSAGDTLTFLFTDVEGSTRLLARLKDRYPQVLEQHRRLLREAFTPEGGTEVSTQGDSFFFAFDSAREAVAAAVAGQRALAGHGWPEEGELRVRMGAHTGETGRGSDRFAGIGVHRAARIAAAAHGGQILLSGTTHDLVADELPDGVELVDLGEHRLKDLDRPERVYQVVAEGLPSAFPPPATAERPGRVTIGPLLRIRLSRPAWWRRRSR